MNYYAVFNGINAVLSLTIASIIFLGKSRKPIQLTYAFFSLLLFFWAFFYFMWGIQTRKDEALFWLKCLIYSICFIHTAYFHFTLIVTDKIRQARLLLITAYVSSFGLCLLNYFDLLYSTEIIRAKGAFLFWPYGTRFLLLLIAIQTCFVLISFALMAGFSKSAPEPARSSVRSFLIAALIGWPGGLFNWFYWFDAVPIPPIGNIGVTYYLLSTPYLIFKHDILQLNIAVRRTFIYACLTLFISLTYTLTILISERLFQFLVGYSTLIGSVIAGGTIAIFFNPMRYYLVGCADKIAFGKGLEQISSEYARMKEELQNQDKMKAVATLAAGMAHEVRNPLTAIKTFTERLPQKSNDPQFISKFTEVVGSEINKIDSIVKQLLEFSKPSPLTLEKLDLRQVTDETLELLNSEFIKHKIRVEKNYNELVQIDGDKKRLKQAFLNLFLNSIQAMPDGGTLTVSTFTNGHRQLQVSISDTSIGIPKENIPHLFDPFFTTKPNGTGLGLSIVHGIIKEHKGKIEVSSQPGTGTTFTIHLK